MRNTLARASRRLLMPDVVGEEPDLLSKIAASALGLGLVAGLAGLAIYFFAFGQTFEGPISISASSGDPDVVATVRFQSRFKNRRFLTHSLQLDLRPNVRCTYLGQDVDTEQLVTMVGDEQVDARLGYREDKPGWGRVVTLDVKPPRSSPKEALLVVALLLIFGCTAGMAVVAKTSD